MVLLNNIWIFLNSSFPIAFIGGLTGAVGGALGAQYIAERAKRREEQLRELRSTNAAIVVSFSICNGALALKHQHVQPMWEKFANDKIALEDFQRRRAVGEVSADAVYELTADMRSFFAPIMPIETLKTLVYERISAYGRPLAIVAVLEQSLVGMQEVVRKRDQLVRTFSSGTVPKELFSHYYFGLTQKNGNTNQEYPDVIEALHSYVDDVAFFSSLLCEDLIKHGVEIRAALTKKSEKNVPRVSTADFTGPKARGVMPQDSQYKDWISAFQSHDKPVEESAKPR
jgi:hypothetical protein